jgi:hypothetical protein
MSDEFCAGVKILLKRMESNPDEFIEEFGKWSSIVNAVFSRKLGGDAIAIRSLTNAEAEALYEGLIKVYRPEFDEYVMKNMLDETKELKYQAKERFVQGWTDPRMNVNVPPGTMLTVTGGGSGGSGQVQIKPESVMSKLKRELGL